MKRSILFCGLLSVLLTATLAPRRAEAASGAVTGTVETIAAHGLSGYTNWFTLLGVTSATGCPTSTLNGALRVIFTIASDDLGKQQMSLLEMEMMSGRGGVRVSWDTSHMLGGYCQAIAIYANPYTPPPSP